MRCESGSLRLFLKPLHYAVGLTAGHGVRVAVLGQVLFIVRFVLGVMPIIMSLKLNPIIS